MWNLGRGSFWGLWVSQLLWHHLLKSLYLLCWMFLYLCPNPLDIFMWVYFWVLYSVSLISVSVFPPIPHSPDYSKCIISFEIGWIISITFFFFKMVLAVQGSVPFHIHFIIIFAYICKKNFARILVQNGTLVY